MTTGASLYLVSACANAEEFVAAFRRYADRSGLFVPIAEPFPQGGRGRIAIALTDGRVVLEGDIEVAQASLRPSPLYGRVGMTLKFIDPDPTTRTTLTELEKARLAMKPAPLTAVPHDAGVPPSPRPVPPPVGGRIDALNALAECVAIGDLALLREGAPKPASDSPSSKFIIPTIPQPGARAKTASVPPALQSAVRKTGGTMPPPLPGSGPVVVPTKPSTKQEQKATTMGMPAIDRVPAPAAPEPPPVVSAKITKQGVEPQRRDPTPVPKREPVVGRQTTLGMPLVRPPADESAAAAVSTGAASAPRRANTPSTPPMPRHPTPYTPLPIVRRPAPDLTAHLEESTERNQIPEPPLVGEEQRKNSLGVAMLHATRPESESETLVEADASGRPTLQQAAIELGEATDVGEVPSPAPTAARSGSLRASEIMTAMKGEDWTMTPDAVAPTPLPKTDASAKAAEEKSGPHEDFVISLDPAAPGGWSAPAKVEKLPESKQNPASGNRNIAISSGKAIEAIEWEEKPTGIGEALVQIDPTLMEPAGRMPSVSDDEEPISIVSSPLIDIEPPVRPTPVPSPKPPAMPASVARAFAPPLPLHAPEASNPAGSGSRYDPTEIARFGMGPNEVIAAPAKPKRSVVPIILIAGAAVLITVLVIMLTGNKKQKPVDVPAPIALGSGSAGSASMTVPQPPRGSDQVAIAPPGDAAVPVVEAPPPPTTCSVEVTTVPAGADIMLDNATVLGTSPATIPMPCGAAQKVTVRKAKYGSATRAFTATATATKLAIKIPPPMLQLKVTSLPAGATITVGGKTVGITPTAVKVVAGGPISITLSKDGYTPDTQKIAPRPNNAAHHVILKRAAPKKR